MIQIKAVIIVSLKYQLLMMKR